MQREAAAERAESLRKWAQGLQDAQLERGVPHATQAQEWRGATVQGAHPLNINHVGVRKEVGEHGVVLWEPGAGYNGLEACLAGVQCQELHLAGHLSLSKKGGSHATTRLFGPPSNLGPHGVADWLTSPWPP